MPTPTMQARWVLPERDVNAEDRLRKELGVHEIVAALLVQRGFSDPESAHKFLNPSLDDLHDPSSLPDYESAKNEILGAKERGDLIFVHGDYDVDGVTSAAILHRFLKSNLETSKETPKVSWNKGDAIRVVEGPFSDFSGKIEEVNSEKEKLKVLINIFGRDTPVELDFTQIEKL